MLKGEIMCCKTDSLFIDGAQFGGLVDRTQSRLMPWSFIADYFSTDAGRKLSSTDLHQRIKRVFGGEVQGRYQPASKKPESAQKILGNKCESRYYTLESGDIIDTETRTILSRKALLDILG